MTLVSHEIYSILATYRVRDPIVVFRNRLHVIHLILESKLVKNVVDFIDFMTPVSLVNFMDLLTHRYHRFHDTNQSISATYHVLVVSEWIVYHSPNSVSLVDFMVLLNPRYYSFHDTSQSTIYMCNCKNTSLDYKVILKFCWSTWPQKWKTINITPTRPNVWGT